MEYFIAAGVLVVVVFFLLVGYRYAFKSSSELQVWRQEVRFWDRRIAAAPDGYNAYNNRGFAYAKKGDWEKVIADFTEAIRINPDYAKAYYNRGAAYEEKGDKAKADADLAKAKELGYKP